MKTNLAPIALFVYNRPTHTQQTLNSLMSANLAELSQLYIFADGAKLGADANQIGNIKATRKIIKELNWPGKLTIIESETNKGLANSIIEGVTKLVNEFGKVIVLEDDLLVSKSFLEYMNDALNTYKDFDNIYSVNGFMFPIKTKQNRTFLLPYTSTWAWATWKEKWAVFEPELNLGDIEILQKNSALKSRFNLNDYSYTDMLNFGNNSWGIKWYFSVFIRSGLNVFPSITLVKNIGNDGSGVNSKKTNEETLFKIENKVEIVKENKLNLDFLNLYYNNFKVIKKNTLILKTKSIIKRIKK